VLLRTFWLEDAYDYSQRRTTLLWSRSPGGIARFPSCFGQIQNQNQKFRGSISFLVST
jgi:hypothetical protein